MCLFFYLNQKDTLDEATMDMASRAGIDGDLKRDP
jgi:hypothetical protein